MLRWTGSDKGAEGIPDVPARDLTEDEVRALGLSKKQLVATGLYREDKRAAGPSEDKEA